MYTAATDSEEQQLPDTADLGEIVAGYRLEERIGSGGMGHVYAAVHLKLNRRAAVKVLDAKFVNDDAVLSRFYQEARIANAVRHPNIVDIFDFVELEAPRRVACVMELIEGPTLKRLLKAGPLRPVQAYNVTLQMADALATVHEQGVIHRDLKPDNVMLVADPNSDLALVPSVKLLDFGIAKMPDVGSAHKTGTGMVLGTPAYMAPEQISGEGIGTRTDVYALGELLFEMLTGRRVFPGKATEVFRRKLSRLIPELELPDSVLDEDEVRALIQRTLALEVTERIDLAAFIVGVRALKDGLGRARAPSKPWPAITQDLHKRIEPDAGTTDVRANAEPASGPAAVKPPADGLAFFDRPPSRAPVVTPAAPLPLPKQPVVRRPRLPWLTLAALTLGVMVFSTRARELLFESIAFMIAHWGSEPAGPVRLSDVDRARLSARVGKVLSQVAAAPAESPDLALVGARQLRRSDRSKDYAESLGILGRALAARPSDPIMLAEWARGLVLERGASLSRDEVADVRALLGLANDESPNHPAVDSAEAELALALGQTTSAANHARSSLEKLPDDATARLALAEALANINPQRALVETGILSQAEPEQRRRDRVDARSLANLGRYHEAFELLQRRLKNDAKNAAVLRLWGDMERELGNEARASMRYEAAAGGEGDQAAAHIAAGFGYAAQYNFKKAEEQFNTVLTGASSDRVRMRARVGLARTALARGERFVGAELKNAIEAEHEDVPSLLVQAELKAASGALAAADTLAQGLMQQPSAAPAALALRAKAATARGAPAEAAALLVQALALDPYDAELRVVVAADRLDAGDAAGATLTLGEASRLDPRDYQARLERQPFPIARFMVDEARQKWEAAAKDKALAPEAETALALLALAHDARGDAKVHAKKALQLAPETVPTARALLIHLALEQRAYDEALTRASEWSKLDSGSAVAELGRARALSALKRKNDAAAAYANALRIDPKLALATLESRALGTDKNDAALVELIGQALVKHPAWTGAAQLAWELGL